MPGWNVFRAKDGNWTRFDMLNSPVKWGRSPFVDLWITCRDGICFGNTMFDGKERFDFQTDKSQLGQNISPACQDKGLNIWFTFYVKQGERKGDE